MSESLLEANYKTSGRQLFLTKKEKKNKVEKKKWRGEPPSVPYLFVILCDTLFATYSRDRPEGENLTASPASKFSKERLKVKYPIN